MRWKQETRIRPHWAQGLCCLHRLRVDQDSWFSFIMMPWQFADHSDCRRISSRSHATQIG